MRLETASILCAVKSTSLEQGYVSGRESWFPDMLMDMPQHVGNSHDDVREYVTKHTQKSLENMNQACRMLQGGEGGGADKRANCYKIIEDTARENSIKRAYVEYPHCPWSKLFPSWTEAGVIAFPVTKNVGFENPFYAKGKGKGKDTETSDKKTCQDNTNGLLHKLFKTGETESAVCPKKI